ncbi:MAG: metallophosphoesterase [Bacteroidales bacterium]
MTRTMAFLLFFGIVLTIYLLGNYYVFARGMQALPEGSSLKTPFIWIFWMLAATYIAGRILEKIYLGTVSDVLIWTGSFWLAALLYFFLAVLLFDLFRLIHHFLPFYPAFITGNMDKTRYLLFTGTIVTVAFLITGGFINARNPVVRKMDIQIDSKQQGERDQIKAVLLSDIHLGTVIGNGHLRHIIGQVNSLNPDIILLAGDILDEDLEPLIRQNTGETLKQLKAPLGIYGIMGNHEHIGGAATAHTYLENHGIQMIRDTVLNIEDRFYLAGRDDRDKKRFSGKARLSLERLLHNTDMDYPVILMDHQPLELEKAAKLGVSMQLSGHTHHGQLWPLSYITQSVYQLSHGYRNINGMHAYVSTGIGTWGPPVRIGNRPEIVQLNIKFGEK